MENEVIATVKASIKRRSDWASGKQQFGILTASSILRIFRFPRPEKEQQHAVYGTKTGHCHPDHPYYCILPILKTAAIVLRGRVSAVRDKPLQHPAIRRDSMLIHVNAPNKFLANPKSFHEETVNGRHATISSSWACYCDYLD